MRTNFRIVFWVFLMVAAVGALAAGIGLRMVSDKLQTSPTQLVLERPFHGRDMVNILLLGEDQNYQKDKERGRTDTIIVAAIDLESRRANAISIPRDTRVMIPGHGYQKINAAYTFEGGPQLVAQTVANLLNVDIHYYAKTNIAGLKGVVDTVGGVEIDIEKNMYYRDRRGGLYINLKKGHRHLDGDKALQYVRFRHDRMGDLWRVERQRKFLKALARRLTSPENWSKLPQAIDEIMQNVETNMSARELLALAKLAKDVPEDSVVTETLPGAADTIGGISYYIVDDQKMPVMVNEVLRFEPKKPSVAVLNGSGIEGSAERLADVLRNAGYPVERTGNADSFGYSESQVYALDPSDSQTVAIAELLNCQPLPLGQDRRADAQVLVIVGRDYY